MKNLGLRILSFNFGTTLIRQIVVGLVGIGTVALIARHYGREGNGAFNILLILPNMLNVFMNLGISGANIYYIGAGKVNVKEAFQANLFVAIFITIVGLIAGGLILMFWGNSFFPGVSEDLLWLSLLTFPFSLLTLLFASIFQGEQDFKSYNKVMVSQPIIFLFAVVALVLMENDDLTYLVLANLLAFAAVVVRTFFSVKKKYFSDKTVMCKYSPYLKKSFGYGGKIYLSNIFGFLNYRLDIFLVNYIVSTAATGLYVVAVAIAEKLWVVSTALSAVLLPRLSELSKDEEKRRELTPLMTRLMTLFMISVGIALLFVAKPAIQLVFGREYDESIRPLFYLLPGVLSVGVARIWANDIASRGRAGINMIVSFLTVTTNVIGNLILIPKYGIIGAAGATSISYCFTSFVTLIIYSRLSSNSIFKNLFIQPSDIKEIKKLLKPAS